MQHPKQHILLANAYFYQYDLKQWQNKTPYPPLGTIWAAAYLRENGYDVSLYDVNLRASIEDLQATIGSSKPHSFVIYDDGFNYLTKMCLTRMREETFRMIKIAKGEGLTVFVSSSDSTDHYEKYLKEGADVVMLGEGEETVLELLGGKPFSEVLGIAYKDGDKIKVNARRPVIKDLDQIPLPAWDLVDVDAYRKIWDSGKYPFALNIATTRGCPFKCNWCAKPIYGNRYNSRSPEQVVQEIKQLVNIYGVNNFWMCDDIFGLKPGWVKEFRKLIEKENLNIHYKIQSRADLLLAEENIDDLAKSGLYEVWLGAESGSQKILDAMDKGTSIAQIKEATARLQKHGVRVAYFLQFGYLGETKEDIDKTLKMLQDFKPDDIGISVSYPLPGTKFYDTVKEQLGQKQNWEDSDDLAMLFKGTFNGEYYKTLQRYVHRIFRKQLAVNFLKKGFKSNDKLAVRNLILLPYNTLQAFRLKQKLNRMNNLS